MHRSLADYAYSSFFEPFVDVIDLKPGFWLRQLVKKLASSHCFIPILTSDYFDGPVSQKEYRQALDRRSNTDNKIAIIPALREGDFAVHRNSPLGELQMVDFRDNDSYDMKVEELAKLLWKKPE